MADPTPPPPPSFSPSAGAAPEAEHRFPCPNCGADYRFDPARGTLHCDFCGHEEAATVPAGPWDGGIKELDFQAAIRNLLPAQEMETTRVSSCPSCGAQVELAASEHATVCPFCATPVVTDTGTHRHIKPRGVLPFALPEAQAHDAMTNWLGQLWFAPNGLSAYARKGRKMAGVYVPYWTFDAQTVTEYAGRRGTVHVEMRAVRQGGKTVMQPVTRVRWRNVRGRVQRFFDDVLVMASTSLPRKYVEALPPWDLSAMEPYRPDFLAGFQAEGYSVELDDGFRLARQQMDNQIRRDIKFDIGGDRQDITRADTQISDVTFKHVLLPVWVAAYKYRGQSYRFVVNGQTGRVEGERPYSAWKIAFAVILGLIVAGAVAFVAAQQ